MSTYLPPRIQITSQASLLSEVRRITVEGGSVLLEVRDSLGGFHPEKEVFLDEIQAVYVWEATDWSLIVTGGILTLGAVSILLLVQAETISPAMAFGYILLAIIVIGAIVHLAMRARARRWVRLESTQGPIQFHTRRPGVLEALLALLSVEDPVVMPL